MQDRRDLLLKSTSALRVILEALDAADFCPKAAVHVQWAIDLLEKEFVESADIR